MLAAKLLTIVGEYDYYVDSVNGSDANDGTSAATAFATISALPELEAGDRVGLARGSHWREQLNITANNVRVGAYGTGERPILDGSDVITAWSKTAGQTNVYQATVDADINVAKTWVNVWEDDAFLVRATSIADCDATPGSYYPSADIGTGPITLYVHTTNSNDPASNGSTYEVATRRYGLNADTRTGVRVTGIVTRRQLFEDGSLAVGPNAILTDCRFEDGNKHNVIYRDGSVLTNCVAENNYYAGSAATLFVLNQSSPTGLGVRHVRCQALNTVGAAGVDGFLSHINTSGNFGTVEFTDCTARNCQSGFTVGNVMQAIYDGCLVDGFTLTGITANNNTVIRNSTQLISSETSQHRAVYITGTGVTVEIDGALICVGAPSGGAVYVNANNAELTVQNSVCSTRGALVYVPGTRTGVVFDSHDNIINSGSGYIYEIRQALTINSDNNQLYSSGWPFFWQSAPVTTFASWQSTTGQDANSTFAPVDASVACA